jgi:transcriptional regulator with XRE-family HTH domain
MEDKYLIDKIKTMKEQKGYTLYELSKIFDVQISTLDRWLKTNRINRMYAKFVKEKLGLK